MPSELPVGPDVSFHQRRVDWAAAFEDGVSFCFIRWGQRKDWADPWGPNNWLSAKRTPIFRGAYWVWDERGGDDAEDHMDGVLAVASACCPGGYNGQLPMVADLELEPVSWSELHKWLLMLEAWSGRRPMIYTGAWFYNRIAPLPDWLADYDHWLTGYNDTGPSIWGPLKQLDPTVICWQQSPAWRVSWTESGTADRNEWWAGAAHLLEYASMADKVVKVQDLLKWVQENAYDAEGIPGGTTAFRLQWPAPPPVVVTQAYGINGQFYPGQKGHEGIDIRAGRGVQIFAAAEGKVYRVEDDAASGPYGKQVRIEHPHPTGPYKTVYAHLLSTLVNVDDQVTVGQVVGLADNTGNSTGSHLHLVLKKVGDGSEWLGMDDIVNPTPYLVDIFPGRGPWLVDVAGNLRTTPRVASNNLVRLVRAGEILVPTGLFTGDWWEVGQGGASGWFWNPGYKLSAT